jgi:predicted dehydrogenase
LGGDPNRRRSEFEKFLSDAPKVLFNKPRYFQWRLYWDYSGGISTDLLVHQTDAIQMITGRHYCKSVTCNGGIHAWAEDGSEVPDTITAGFEYDDRFHINYSVAFSNIEELLGTEGTMIISQLADLDVDPETLRARGPKVTSHPEIQHNSQKEHAFCNSARRSIGA